MHTKLHGQSPSAWSLSTSGKWEGLYLETSIPGCLRLIFSNEPTTCWCHLPKKDPIWALYYFILHFGHMWFVEPCLLSQLFSCFLEVGLRSAGPHRARVLRAGRAFLCHWPVSADKLPLLCLVGESRLKKSSLECRKSRCWGRGRKKVLFHPLGTLTGMLGSERKAQRTAQKR